MMRTQSLYQYATPELLCEIERFTNGETLCAIARPSDGAAVVFRGAMADQARDCIAKHGAARTIASYLKAAPYAAERKGEWQPVYDAPAIAAAINAGANGRIL